MRKIILIISMLLVVVFLSGCNEKHQFDTLSGKPEAIIVGIEKNKLVNSINNEMVNQGYNIEETSDYKLVYEKNTDETTAIFYGSDFNSTPKYRITINMVIYEDKIRTIATIEIVTNPRSAFEKIKDITYSQSGEKYYKILQNIKAELEKE